MGIICSQSPSYQACSELQQVYNADRWCDFWIDHMLLDSQLLQNDIGFVCKNNLQEIIIFEITLLYVAIIPPLFMYKPGSPLSSLIALFSKVTASQ